MFLNKSVFLKAHTLIRKMKARVFTKPHNLCNNNFLKKEVSTRITFKGPKNVGHFPSITAYVPGQKLNIPVHAHILT